MMRSNSARLISLVLLLLCVSVSISSGQIVAHEPDRESGNHDQAVHEGRGDGVSGTVAAWLLGIANFPVALSLLLKTSAKVMRSRVDIKEAIKRFNLRQKKRLMGLHYWINPLAVGFAILHFSSSECRSTVFPELGLVAMIFISALGLLMTFRLSPAFMSKAVFRLHTSPVLLGAVLSILLVGHMIID
jgi:hypothetical protein